MAEQTFKYGQYPWGDHIEGTKDELQAIGLGIGLAFPGEPGGPKRALKICDPRGFATEIKRSYSEGCYSASIPFPGRSRPDEPWVDVGPGLKKCEHTYGDVFVGTSEALAAAGIVRLDQLPGQPGMRKFRVTIFPDGSVPGGAATSNHREARLPGAKSVERATKTTYQVCVRIQGDEEDRRLETSRMLDRDYEARMHALRRPVPLIAGIEAEQQAKAQIDKTIAEKRVLADVTLGLLPKSPAEYRQKLIEALDSAAYSLRKRMLPSKGTGVDGFSLGITGFSLDESAVTEFEDLLGEIRELLLNAGVRFNAQRQKEIVSNCKSAIAKADRGFQSALARIQDVGHSVHGVNDGATA